MRAIYTSYSFSQIKTFLSWNIRMMVLVLLCGGIAGCSTTVEDLGTSNLSSYLSQQQAIAQYRRRCPPLTDPHVTQVVEAISDRLVSASGKSVPRVQIEVLACSEPFSLAASPRDIMVSVGMLQRLPTEAAVAFVIGHELSHILLEHFHEDSSSRYPREQEFAADRQALYLVIAAHYNPWASLETFSQPRVFQHGDMPSTTHPLIQERAHLLRELLQKADWRPPGTISSRSFKRLKYQLRSY